MIKLILKISPMVLLLVLQGCSDEYCCNIPGTDAIEGYCSDGSSQNELDCWENEEIWTEGIDAVNEFNECYSDQEECEDNCSHNVDADVDADGDGNCQEGKE